MFADKMLKAGVCAAGLIWPAVSYGQAADGAAVSDNTDIVVTAQKRSERLQEVPISVAVLSGAELQSDGARGLQDLRMTVPGVQILHGGPSDRLYVRGIGSGDNPAFDQAVAAFVDGVYHGRSRTTAASFLDIDRSEFLKGPQSTFFGNSAISGAINITTAKPSDELEGYLFGSYNFNFDQYIVEGAISGPIAENLSGRISAQVGEGDGYITDTTAREKIPATNDRTIRAQLRWQPSDRLTFDLKGEAGRYNQKGGIATQVIGCPPVIASASQNGFPGPAAFCINAITNGDDTVFNNRRSFNRGGFSNLSNEEVVLAANYDLGSVTLSSTTAYLHYDYRTAFEQDNTSSDLFTAAVPERYRQFSQEFRLTSDDTGFLSYMLGAYYQNDRLRGATIFNYGFLATPLRQSLNYNQLEKIYAGFASVDLHFTDKLTVTGGVRAQRVEKDLVKGIYYGAPASFTADAPVESPAFNAIGQASNLGPAGRWNFSRSDTRLTPSAKIQYKFSRDLMVYGSYANGFKAGGFNFVSTGVLNPVTGRQDNVPFRPEKVDNFEIGFKSQLFDRRLTFNVAAFHSRYTDLQVGGNRQTPNGPVNVVSNAAASISRGIEAEANLRISSSLRTEVQFVVLDAHYKSFPGAIPTACQARVGQCVFGSTTPGATVQDLSGKQTPYAPNYSGTWTVDYQTPLGGDFDIALGSKLFFTDKFNVSINNDPFLEQDAYVQLDLSARLINSPGGWEVGVIAKNVNNVKTFNFGTGLQRSSGSFIVVKDPPRSFTVQFRKTF
jgi:iron complex outermembrane recepter protein